MTITRWHIACWALCIAIAIWGEPPLSLVVAILGAGTVMFDASQRR